jgi:hypothetical protein
LFPLPPPEAFFGVPSLVSIKRNIAGSSGKEKKKFGKLRIIELVSKPGWF